MSSHLYIFSTYFISVTLGCRLPRRPLVAELSGWWIINCLSSAKVWRKNFSGHLCRLWAESAPVHSQERSEGSLAQRGGWARWRLTPPGNNRLRSGHCYCCHAPHAEPTQGALQAIHCHLCISCLRGFLDPMVLILPMIGYEFQKTGSSPQPMNRRRKWGCSSWHPHPKEDSAPGPHDCLLAFFLGFLPFPGLLLCSPVSASWNHLLNQLPVSDPESQVCSWSNRN